MLLGAYGAFPGNAVDVSRLVTHYAPIVGADVIPADFIAPDDEDIWLPLLRRCRNCHQGKRQQHGTTCDAAAMLGHNIPPRATDTVRTSPS